MSTIQCFPSLPIQKEKRLSCFSCWLVFCRCQYQVSCYSVDSSLSSQQYGLKRIENISNKSSSWMLVWIPGIARKACIWNPSVVDRSFAVSKNQTCLDTANSEGNISNLPWAYLCAIGFAWEQLIERIVPLDNIPINKSWKTLQSLCYVRLDHNWSPSPNTRSQFCRILIMGGYQGKWDVPQASHWGYFLCCPLCNIYIYMELCEGHLKNLHIKGGY